MSKESRYGELATMSPIELGSILFTMVEPTKGHEVSYNRWYERDHFYAGCLIGPYLFSGGRFVATRDLKALRYPADSPITPDPTVGSYLALYWVLDGHHDDWNRWAVDQVIKLHEAKRMFSERKHIHTQLYRYDHTVSRDPDGVPPELALDHPFKGLVSVVAQSHDAEGRSKLVDWFRDEHLPQALRSAALCLTFMPLPLLVDAPSDVPRSEDDDVRLLQLYFLDRDPREVWDEEFAGLGKAVEGSGLGKVVFASPFIPTIPGTDTYTDEL